MNKKKIPKAKIKQFERVARRIEELKRQPGVLQELNRFIKATI